MSRLRAAQDGLGGCWDYLRVPPEAPVCVAGFPAPRCRVEVGEAGLWVYGMAAIWSL